jgi:hypothetical protein
MRQRIAVRVVQVDSGRGAYNYEYLRLSRDARRGRALVPPGATKTRIPGRGLVKLKLGSTS